MISARSFPNLTLPFVALVLLVLSGCTRYDDFEGEVYDCEVWKHGVGRT